MRSKARWVRVWFEVSMGLQSIVLYATASYGVTFAFARRADVP
jgi:hypothetical protein